MAANYQITLTDAFGDTLAVINKYSTLQYARKQNSVGSLTLSVPDIYDHGFFQADNRILVERNVDGLGYSLDMETAWLIREFGFELRGDGEKMINVQAKDALNLLTRRVVAYNSGNDFTVKDLPLDDMIKEIADENLGSAASDTDRDWSTYLTIEADKGAGWDPPLQTFGRRELLRLFQELAELSLENGTFLSFDIVYNMGAKTFQLRTYTGQRGIDRTQSGGADKILISPETGALVDVSVTFDHTEEKTFVYNMHPGVGDIESPATASDTDRISTSPFGRNEVVISTDAFDVNVQQQDAESELRRRRPKRIFQGRLQETENLRYGVEYGYGDKVTAAYGDDQFDCHIEAVSVNVSERGESVEAWLRSEETI